MTRWWMRFALFVMFMLTSVRVYTVWVHGEVPPWVWGYGLLADTAALVVLAAIASLGLTSRFRWVRAIPVVFVVVIVLLVAAAEAFYWHEFETRLDRLVFHYLAYPVEVLVFLEEQFYITWVVVPFVLLVALVMRCIGLPPLAQNRGALLGLFVVAVVVLFLVRQPVPDASRHFNQLASNGYVGVLTAATLSADNWSGLYPGIPYPQPTSVQQPLPDNMEVADRGVPGRAVPGNVMPIGRKNVVLIIEESFSGPNWTNPKLRQAFLPELDRLLDQGLAFTGIYAAGTRTTRGMESLMHGFPPLPGISATEREGVERLPSLPRALRDAGYRTIFAYGGWPDFSNFTRYWRSIGFEQTTSRDHFPPGTFETSWGVEDGALFSHILGLLDDMTAGTAPVFLAALTVTNHRPFSVPPDVGQADERSLNSAMHYADSALGAFFREARTRDWYADTLFVVVADHGPRIHGESLIPVESYRIPLVMISEPALTPAVIADSGSAIGVPATILQLLGITPEQPFWGLPLLNGASTMIPVEHDYHVGQLVGGRLTVLTRGGRFFTWQQSPEGLIAQGEIPQSTPAAQQVAAYFGSAHRFFYNPMRPTGQSGSTIAQHRHVGGE